MFLKFGGHKIGTDYGVVIDIGSGSVGVAIFAFDQSKQQPRLIWTYREKLKVTETNETLVVIKKTILNTLNKLGQDGLAELGKESSGKISSVQVSVAAPWAQTVTRTIHMQAERSFAVTRELLEELIDKASDQAETHIKKNLLEDAYDLKVVNNKTINITENGYRVRHPYRENINKLTVTQLTAMISADLDKHVTEAINRQFPKADLYISTFVDNFYSALDRLSPDTHEACLIDVTASATELGVIRRGVLESASHINFGSYTFANKISQKLKVLPDEALRFLRNSESTSDTTPLSASQQASLDEIIVEYETELSELFKRTGDALSLPKSIFLHTDHRYEEFYAERIKKAAEQSTETDHAVHMVTSKFFAPEVNADSSLLLSGYVLRHELSKTDYFAKNQ